MQDDTKPENDCFADLYKLETAKKEPVKKDEFGKFCSVCKSYKLYEMFSRQSNGVMGYRSDCKECFKNRRGYKPNNPDDVRVIHPDFSRRVKPRPEYDGYKLCTDCNQRKSLDEFSKDSSKLWGKSRQCKVCYNNYRLKNIDREKARRDHRSVEHKERDNNRTKAWYRANPDRVKNKSLARFGITIEDFNAMFVNQNGCCKICKNMLLKDRNTQVDHCHTTGLVRGLLCHTCNTKLGWFEHSQNWYKLHTASIDKYLVKD